MSTFNGIGTKLYGMTDVGPDGSYVCTKWFVLVYLPIVPLESYRVIKESSTNLIVYQSQQYRVVPVELHKKQVLRTYLFFYGIIGFIYLLAKLI